LVEGVAVTHQASHTHRGAGAAHLVEAAATALARVRDERPRVHVLTNPVAMTLSANLLLAAGAVPSMTPDPAAQADFVGTSRALVVNLGMLDGPRVAALRRAVPEARRLGRPWLLDPVKVERSPDRLALARELADAGPAVVRGNAAELAALAGGADGPALAAFARARGLTAAATGPVDLVADGAGRTARVANGSPLMDRVTAMGCAASALAGAFLAVEPDPFLAAVAALLTAGVAGDVAAESARGPGSFVPAFLDAVHALDAGTLAARARLSP
jgi:hydroxyethylthiazole kinase